MCERSSLADDAATVLVTSLSSSVLKQAVPIAMLIVAVGFRFA